MDTESLKPLLSILLWGGLFFFLMRFGCGAHMMGGHGHHVGQDDTGRETKDPVCGMTVDRDRSTAASVYQSKTYYFCSASCRDKFEQAPDKCLAAVPQSEPQQGGHLRD